MSTRALAGWLVAAALAVGPLALAQEAAKKTPDKPAAKAAAAEKPMEMPKPAPR